MNIKKLAGILAIAFTGSIIGVVAYTLLVKPEVRVVQEKSVPEVRFTGLPAGGLETADFRLAAEQSIHAVVHVTSTKFTERYRYRDIWEYLSREPSSKETIPQEGFGSGVIISSDGYIVTNNHVIKESDEITVKLNDGRVLKAELIGTDPNSDVAVIKVKEDNLSYLPFGHSDDLMVGDWVLAVGNPWNLYSTVTAGIVSAKGREFGMINPKIIRDQYGRTRRVRNPEAIESFIQTDAAVNQGNSGGALVNLQGELVGINTMIQSPTGAFSGYSFAIPSVIVERVVEDLLKYGSVKRAALGVNIRTVDATIAEEEKLDVTEGVLIENLTVDGGAKKAGVKKGDVIQRIGGIKVASSSELQEQVMKHHPGDVVEIEVSRRGTNETFDVKLGSHDPNAILDSDSEFWAWLGADLEKLSSDDLERMDIPNGVRVKKLHAGQLKKLDVPEGYVITSINRVAVNTVLDVKSIIEQVNEGGVFIEGVLSNGKYEYFTFRK